MLQHLLSYPWHLVLGLSVILTWCVVGWSLGRRPERTQKAAAPVGLEKTQFSWAEDVRRAAHEDLDGFVERWRDRLPPTDPR